MGVDLIISEISLLVAGLHYCQGRSMNKYNNVIWRLHCRWVCCNIVPNSVLSTLSVHVKPGIAFDYFLILAKLVWLNLAYAEKPPLEVLNQVNRQVRDCRGFRFVVV